MCDFTWPVHLVSEFSLLPPFFAQARVALAGDRPGPGATHVGWQQIAIIAAAAIGVIAAAWLAARFARIRQRRASQSPWKLFQDLCAVHSLSNREQQLLTRLARQQAMEQPALIFVDAASWNMHSLGASWAQCLPELERLRRRLFAIR